MTVKKIIFGSKPHRGVWRVLAALKLILFSITWAAPPRFHPILLPQLDPVNTVDNPARTLGQRLNEKGVVVGEFGFPPQSFLWSSQGGGRSLKEMHGWDHTFPLGLNDDTLVGSFSNEGEAPRPFFTLANGGELIPLPKPVEDSRLAAMATAVSRNGIVVGWCEMKLPTDFPTFSRHAVIWKNGRAIDIGALKEKSSAAVAVTNAGMVAGNFFEASGSPTRAFRWSDACGLEELTPLQEGLPSVASQIDESGQTVGFAESFSPGHGTFRLAVLWSPENRLRILPYVVLSKSGSGFAEALAINNKGQVVGQQRDFGESKTHAVLWEGGQGYALKDLTDGLPAGHRLDRAVAINDRGEILVNGFDQRANQFITILLTPISHLSENFVYLHSP